MNAAEKAPSANKARNMLGIRQATANASDAKFAPTNWANSMSRASPSTRLASVNPPTDPSERARFMRFFSPASCGKSALCRLFRRLCAAVPAHHAGLLLRRLDLSHVSGGEVDRIEQQRREAHARHGVGDDLAGKREEEPRRLDQQEGCDRLVGHVADGEQATIAEVDNEMDAVLRPRRNVEFERHFMRALLLRLGIKVELDVEAGLDLPGIDLRRAWIFDRKVLHILR